MIVIAPRMGTSDAQRLLRLRALLGFSQRRLADELGVGKSAVAAWERGDRKMPRMAQRLLELIEIEVGLVEPKTPARPRVVPRRRDRDVVASLALLMLERLMASTGRSHPLLDTSRRAIAQQLANKLGEMKGVGMKVAHLLHGLTFAMPARVREPLEAMQHTAPAMPQHLVTDLLLAHFGEPPRRYFARWSATPAAAASLGQVHRATLRDGREVAVKVQYPRVVEEVKADLRLIDATAAAARFVFKGQDPDTWTSAVRRHLMDECDYRVEAENQMRFKRAFSGWRDVVIPRADTKLSGDRVLVSEWLDGVDFTTWVNNASEQQRQRLGRTIIRVALHSLFELREIVGDPHPGNFLIVGSRLGLVDFGRVHRFTPRFITQYRGLLRALLRKDPKGVERTVRAWQLTSEPDAFDFEAHYRMNEALHAPWLSDVFTFDPEYLRRSWDAILVANPNRFRMHLSAEVASLLELHFGWFGLLARLGARGRWRQEIERHL